MLPELPDPDLVLAPVAALLDTPAVVAAAPPEFPVGEEFMAADYSCLSRVLQGAVAYSECYRLLLYIQSAIECCCKI